MSRRPLLTALLAIVVLLTWVAPVRAQSAPASEDPAAFDERARAAFERAKYAEAARLFDRAFSVAPHSRTKLNAGIAYDRAGQLAQAADAYEAAIRVPQELPEQERGAAQARLEVLKQRLTSVYAPGPPGAELSVGGRVFQTPARFHLVPGRHSITLRAVDGTTTRSVIVARAGEATVLERSTPEPTLLRAPTPPPGRSRTKPAPAEVDRGDDGSGAWPYVAFGSAAVLSGLGVTFGLMTNAAVEEFETTGRTDRDQRDRAVVLRAASFTAFGLAIVSAGAGVVLLLNDSSAPTTRGARRPREYLTF